MEIFIKYQSKRSPASPILNMKIYFSFFILKPLWFLAHRRPLYLHHQRKLIKRTLSILIFINLFNNPLFSFLIKIMPKRKNLIYLIRRNGASFIIIKHSEQTIFLVKELFKEWRKGETLRPSKLGTFTTPSLHLSYKGKNGWIELAIS